MLGPEKANAYGIDYSFSGGRIEYHIPCEVCGKIITTKQFSPHKNYLCLICKAKVKGEYVEKKAIEFNPDSLSADFEHVNRFNKAVKYLSKTYKYDFSEAIEIARKMQDKYRSVPECIAAIEMIRLGHTISPQEKINRYKVDFALYNERIIVEIDGKTFHQNTEFDKEREKEILDDLGRLWKAIRITDEEIYNDLSIIQTKLSM